MPATPAPAATLGSPTLLNSVLKRLNVQQSALLSIQMRGIGEPKRCNAPAVTCSHSLGYSCASRLTVVSKVYQASVKLPNCRRISTRPSRATSLSISICFIPSDKYAQEYVAEYGDYILHWNNRHLTCFRSTNKSTEGNGLTSGCDRTQQDFVEGLMS